MATKHAMTAQQARSRRASLPAQSRSRAFSVTDDALTKLLEASDIVEEMEVLEFDRQRPSPGAGRRKQRNMSTSSCYTPRSEDRKMLHKLSEQKRRDTLKDRLDALKSLIPALQTDTKRNDTIQVVLSKSVEFIHILEDKTKKHTDVDLKTELEKERSRKQTLLREIQTL